MAVTNYKSPGTITEEVFGGTRAIANYTSMGAGQGQVGWPTGVSSSHLYHITNFGFTTADVPAGATINGFEIVYTHNEVSTTDNLGMAQLYMRRSDGTLTSSNVAPAGEWSTSTVETTVGGATNLLGYNEVTAADLLDSDFGFTFQVATIGSGTTPQGNIGWLKIRAHYTPVTGYTLASAQGGFALTGNAASLLRGLALSAGYGAFALTGNAADLRTFKLPCDYGSFTTAGSAASFAWSHNKILGAGGAAYSIVQPDPALLWSRQGVSDFGAYTLSGQNANLAMGHIHPSDTGLFTLTGSDALLQAGSIGVSDGGSYTLTNNPAGLLLGYAVAAEFGSFSLTGQDAGLFNPHKIIADTGMFALSSPGATLSYANTGRRYLVVANETAWLELIRRVHNHLGYPQYSSLTTRHCYKMTHADGRRAMVMEAWHYLPIVAALTPGEQAAVTPVAPSGFSVSTTSPVGEFTHNARIAIACEGDSIITGDYNLDNGVGWLTEAQKFYSQLLIALGSQTFIEAVNLGTGGSKVADCVARKALNIDNLNWPAGAEAVLVLNIGSNDIHHDSTAPSVVYAAIKALVASYLAVKPTLKIVVQTQIARSTSTTNQFALRDLLVAGQASGDLGAAAVSNVGALAVFQDPYNFTNYVNDAVHPDIAAIPSMAQETATVIQSICTGV